MSAADHFIVFGEAHLRSTLQTYARYYNDVQERTGHWTKKSPSLARFGGGGPLVQKPGPWRTSSSLRPRF